MEDHRGDRGDPDAADTPEWHEASARLLSRRGEVGLHAVVESIVIADRKRGIFVTDDADALTMARLYGTRALGIAECEEFMRTTAADPSAPAPPLLLDTGVVKLLQEAEEAARR